jgi:hypothetical protein
VSIVEIIAIIIFTSVGAIKGTGDYSGPKDKGTYLNLYIGSSINSGVESNNSEIVHGGSVGFYFNQSVEIGLEALTTKSYNTNQIGQGPEWVYTETPVLLKLQYHSTSFLPGFFLGLLGGFSIRDLSYEGSTADSFQEKTLTYGGRIGYELFSYKSINIGISTTFLHLDSSSKQYLMSDGLSKASIEKADYVMALAEINYLF